MALSLLYALLGVESSDDLTSIKTQHAKLSAAELEKQRNDEKFRNEERALKYSDRLSPKQQREVKKALYDALYHTVEYSYINPVLNMAIGKALCNAIIAQPQPRDDVLTRYEIDMFSLVLRPIVADAIDDIN